MTRSGNKDYRGKSRRSHPINVGDGILVEEKKLLKTKQRILTQAERHIFENSMGTDPPKIRYDYSFNILSLRGDWESKIKVITLYLPFIVNREKCKKFEELVNEAFEQIF